MAESSYKYVKVWREKNKEKLRVYNHNYVVKHRDELKIKRRERYLLSKLKTDEGSTDSVTLREVSQREQTKG